MAYPNITVASAAVMAVVVVAALLPATASAVSYMVGDAAGWAFRVNYTTWADNKEFFVGDTLEFMYTTGLDRGHNVVLVDERSYQSCSVPSNAPTLHSGDDKVPLNRSGPWFFICGIPGHCQAGMKLAVNADIPGL